MDISIIVCTCNRAPSLRETLVAIDLLHNPQGYLYEVIVVDNGSDLATKKLVNEFPRFKYIHEPRRGLSVARNRGIGESRGGAILFTDDDVRVDSNWMEQLSIPLLSGRFDGVTGLVNIPAELERSWLTSLHRSWLACVPPTELAAPFQLVGASMGFSRRVLEAVPMFDEELGPGTYLGAGDETLFSRQMVAMKFKIAGVREAVVTHYFDAHRLTAKSWHKAAIANGRSSAYIQYHWEHLEPPKPFYRAYARAMLTFWRLRLALMSSHEEAMSVRNIYRISSASRVLQMARESRRPRKYTRSTCSYSNANA